ncbi:hypothetical protein F511_20156 [Dorcoceras hygrometricum]|uniref:CCHC-type domain-containing protein n=1 Tax=Dorcoceras hygrometricum TaxID=472368 RepID=A0A2Z7AB17_9LAMI|nr:hypothetical protein F511_20156 [Dorcoceras hygrometricum]
MQHAKINAMKCMRAIKDRIARPVYQLAIISIETLYHAQQVSRWKSSVRDLQDSSAHHSSVVFRHDKSVGHHSDDSVGLFRHDKSVGQSQRGSQSAYGQNLALVLKSTEARNNKKCSPRNSNQQKNQRTSLYEDTATSHFFSNVDSGLQMGSNRKSNSQGIQRHQKLFKSSAENGGKSTEFRYHLFLSIKSAAATSRCIRKKMSQNDTVPTNSNDIAELHQLTTDTYETNHRLVALNNSKRRRKGYATLSANSWVNTPVTGSRETKSNNDASTNPNYAVMIYFDVLNTFWANFCFPLRLREVGSGSATVCQHKSDKVASNLICYNCDRPGHFAADCNRPRKDDRYRRDNNKDERHKREEEYDERTVDRSKDKSKDKFKERSKDRCMRNNSNKIPSRKHDRKVLVAEESTKSWADSDSETSSSSSSSSESEQEEVHCFMADQMDDDEVFDFSNVEFTRDDLVTALNDMVNVRPGL